MASCWCTVIHPFATILLCLLLIVSLTCPIFSLEVDEAQKMTLKRKYLTKMNKPAEKTIKSSDGDIIDCVLFHNQLAFDHPLLKGKISMEQPKRSYEFSSTMTFQLWNSNGETCPEGTIPIRRISEEEISRFTSLEIFGMKPTNDTNNAPIPYEYASGYLGLGRYHGAKAEINVWAPNVSVKMEYSMSQIRLVRSHPKKRTAIHAGWIVYPLLFNDSQPRFFIYWTVVNIFKKSGCFNLLCSGFVHTNPDIALGVALRPISILGGDSYQIKLSIEKEQTTGNWKLFWGNQRSEIGYWPSQLLPQIQDSVAFVYFGGEIYNSKPGGVHTTTQMGSGHFPKDGFRRAAYIGNLEVLGPNNKPVPLVGLQMKVSNPTCYSAHIPPTDHDPQLGVHFLYGGPGKGPDCP